MIDAIRTIDRLQDETYRGWAISYDPPPIGWRGADWQATHPDYDAWTDEGQWVSNGLSAQAGTLDELKAEIDAIEEERAPKAPAFVERFRAKLARAYARFNGLFDNRVADALAWPAALGVIICVAAAAWAWIPA